jgi:hypothetical protein
MAQTGYTPILLYSSSTPTNAPAAGNLTNSTFGSELAINIADGKLFYKDPSNNVQVIAWKTTPTTAGGTGLTSYTAGDLIYYASGTTLTTLAIGATGRWLGSSGTAPQWNAPAALTKTDDTNVTLTLGGSASTALLNAASLTLGWTGTLAVSRGGTGTGTAFTAGSIVFAGASGVYSQDNASLFWDDSNNRLGIGTSSPDARLAVQETNTAAVAATIVGIATTSGGLFRINCSDLSLSQPSWTIQTGNNEPLIFTQSSTERMRIHGSGGVSIGDTTDPGAGNLRLGTGNLVIGTSGKGIDFSANSHAGGMTSELLDWYEEGTWTPFLADSSLNASEGQTYNIQLGFYTRIGNYVYASCRITMTSIGTLTTAQRANIGGLPFTSANTTGNISAGCVSSVDGMSLGGAFMPFVRVDPNTAYMPLSKLSGTTGGSILTVGQFTATGEINVSIGYFV